MITKSPFSSFDENLPSTANASYLPIALSVVRGVIQISSGFGFAWASAVTGDQMTMIATGLVMFATLIWSAWQKISAIRESRRAQVGAAVASANASIEAGYSVPVTVVETPPGFSNVAVLVPRVEQLTVSSTTLDLNRAEIKRHQ